MTRKQQTTRFRIVGDDTGLAKEDRFYGEEVQLALRNRGMPLEMLRHPVTPAGLHYVLVHYDIPHGDEKSWRLKIGGLVDRPLTLSIDDIKRRAARTLAVTMECAGNGRALLSPRAISQPWGVEAIGTAEWTGTPLAPLLREAGLSPDACEVIFTGLDRGVEKERIQAYQRSLSVEEALRPWRGWKFGWHARPGRHTLCVRATDETGQVQPDMPEWNRGGYGNNMLQRVEVVVD